MTPFMRSSLVFVSCIGVLSPIMQGQGTGKAGGSGSGQSSSGGGGQWRFGGPDLSPSLLGVPAPIAGRQGPTRTVLQARQRYQRAISIRFTRNKQYYASVRWGEGSVGDSRVWHQSSC